MKRVVITGAGTINSIGQNVSQTINSFKEGDCANSVYNGVTITIDFISDNPKKVRVLGLRSFGESLYHSITDACLEFGFKSI